MSRAQAKTVKGFTLIETAIALMVFMLVALAVINLSVFASTALERISVRGELLENARIAVDVMSVHIKEATRIVIDTDRRGLDRMTLTMPAGGTREFRYYSRMSQGEPRYQRLDFGGNELASHIASVGTSLKGDILTLTVITADSIDGSDITVDPISLTVKIKIYNPITFR